DRSSSRDSYLLEALLERRQLAGAQVSRLLASFTDELVELRAMSRPQDGARDELLGEHEANGGSAQRSHFPRDERAHGVQLTNAAPERRRRPTLRAVISVAELLVRRPQSAQEPVGEHRVRQHADLVLSQAVGQLTQRLHLKDVVREAHY